MIAVSVTLVTRTLEGDVLEYSTLAYHVMLLLPRGIVVSAQLMDLVYFVLGVASACKVPQMKIQSAFVRI